MYTNGGCQNPFGNNILVPKVTGPAPVRGRHSLDTKHRTHLKRRSRGECFVCGFELTSFRAASEVRCQKSPELSQLEAVQL